MTTTAGQPSKRHDATQLLFLLLCYSAMRAAVGAFDGDANATIHGGGYLTSSLPRKRS